MKKMFFISISIFTFLLLSAGSLASLVVDVSEKEACMVAPHKFEMNVTNRQPYEDIFYVKAVGTYNKWTWVSNSVLILKPGESEGSSILVHPPEDADMGKYGIKSLVYSSTNRSVERAEKLCFIVFRNYSMQAGNFSLSKATYDPEEQVKASITAVNDGSKKFKNVTFSIKVSKDGEVIADSRKDFDLGIDEEKRVTTSLPLDKYQEPGNYQLSYKVKGRGSVFTAGEASFEVNSIKRKNKTKTVERGYLGSTTKIRIKNLGNDVYERVIRRRISYPAAFLVKAPGASVENVEMASLYRWRVEIEPGESKTVQYRINYWPIYVLLVIIAFLIYQACRYLQIPTIQKEIMKSELSEDKRIFTVSLEIQNRLFGEAENVVIEDAVPSVARVIEDFDTLEPKIIKDEEETKLKWKLDEISSGEERVLHYKVKTLVEAVDYLKLPKASVRGNLNGRGFERKSSEVKLEV